MVRSLLAGCDALKAAAKMRCQRENEEAQSHTGNFWSVQCDFTCRITKQEGYLNTQTNALGSDTLTVTDIRYLMAAAEEYREIIQVVYMEHQRLLKLMWCGFWAQYPLCPLCLGFYNQLSPGSNPALMPSMYTCILTAPAVFPFFQR